MISFFIVVNQRIARSYVALCFSICTSTRNVRHCPHRKNSKGRDSSKRSSRHILFDDDDDDDKLGNGNVKRRRCV